MGLSCECGVDEGEWEWWYEISNDADFEPLDTKKRKRCASCNTLIDVKSDCLRFEKFRYPKDEIEERLYGNEIRLADQYLCRACGEIYLNLDAAGYCYQLGEDLREQLKEYWEITGFRPCL